MSSGRVFASAFVLATLLAACSPDRITPPPATGRGAILSSANATAHLAEGNYRFFIPAEYNGGIFGIDIDNDVRFIARRTAGGEISGHFSYTQSAGGEDFIFSGSVTCLIVYDTPVLQNFPEIPAGIGNRSKWGGLIEQSNDPTLRRKVTSGSSQSITTGRDIPTSVR